MKKTKMKIMIIVLLVIIAIVNLKGIVYIQGASLYFGDKSADNLIIKLSADQMETDYSNIYNVSYLQKFASPNLLLGYEATSMAEIRGNDVTFTNYYSGNKDYTQKNVVTRNGNTCLDNNIMAAITSGIGVESIGYKNAEEGGINYSGAQLAVWEFWNSWVENSGAKENGFEKGYGNGTITEKELNGETERKKAQEFATENTYNVNIYFLKYLPQNNLQVSDVLGFDIDNQPDLILVEVLDEDGNVIEAEINAEENSNISVSVTNDNKDIVKVGEEINYDIDISNNSEEEQQNLILTNKLPKGTKVVKVVEYVGYNEVQLNANEHYFYNEAKGILTVNIDKIEGTKTGSIKNEETGEELEYIKNGTKNYIVTIKANNLDEGIYSQEIKNIITVKKDNKILASDERIDIVSDAFLELESEKLPEKINGNEEILIGLKVTNKGLIRAENVSVKISIPEELSIQIYKIDVLSGNQIENTSEGTTTNEFESDSIEIPEQKMAYIQLKGTVNEIEETKQITIEGTVNEEKVYWTTTLCQNEEGGC